MAVREWGYLLPKYLLSTYYVQGAGDTVVGIN